MKVQAFITSGILEKYVLGMVSEEEVQEVLEKASQHIEIKEEIASIRNTFKNYILSHQVAPPEGLKEKVLEITSRQPSARSYQKKQTSSNSYSNREASKGQAKSENKTGLLVGIIVLAVALLAACFAVYNLYGDVELAKSETVSALNEMDQLKEQQEIQQQGEQGIRDQLAFYTDRKNEIILLKGTRRALGTKATIYWNASTKTAFIDVESLPKFIRGNSLVLWVSSNGKSSKIGVLNTNAPGERTSITYLDDPRSFFLTEESNSDVSRPSRNRILMTGDF